MSIWDNLDKKRIPQMEFLSVDIVEVENLPVEKRSYRVKDSDVPGIPPSPDERLGELRVQLSSIFVSNLGKNYATLETECNITADFFRKILRGTKNIGRFTLAKFVVGAKVDVEVAEEMFVNLGHALDKRNRFDYILMCELLYQDDIHVFNEDLMKYGYPSIFSKGD